MRGLQERIEKLSLWLDERSFRERILLLVSILAIVVFAGYEFFFVPQAARRSAIKARIVQVNTALIELNSQAEVIKARGQKDPDRENRIREKQLLAEVDSLGKRLEDLTVGLVSPREMADVLRGLLTRQKGMILVSLENLPAEELLPREKNGGGADAEERINLYRHPVRIVVSGTYLQALDYLRALEKLPRKLFWEDLQIVVKDHPRAEISLTVYTLSFRRGWIGV